MEFNYERNPTSVTIYGKSVEIPTKTAYFVQETRRIAAEIVKAPDAVKAAEATLEGIRLYLGDEFVNEHFGSDAGVTDAGSLNTDEIGALWVFLNRASAKATEEVLKKYAPAEASH